MRKIAVVGAESSGKTTLSQDLAQALGAAWLPEYARDYLATRATVAYGLADVVAIAQGQVAGEAEPLRWQGGSQTNWLVCDTNALVCMIWAEVRFGHCPAAIRACWQADDYVLHVLPTPDMAWEPDPLRENPEDREALFARYRDALVQTGAAHIVVQGSPTARVQAVLAALGQASPG